jgi:short subunit dehydrogenase-like uncharacterized protein
MGRDREFDTIASGATGFVGRLAAQRLAARCRNGGDVRWAIGGRDQTKLERDRSSFGPFATERTRGLDAPIGVDEPPAHVPRRSTVLQ